MFCLQYIYLPKFTDAHNNHVVLTERNNSPAELFWVSLHLTAFWRCLAWYERLRFDVKFHIQVILLATNLTSNCNVMWTPSPRPAAKIFTAVLCKWREKWCNNKTAMTKRVVNDNFWYSWDLAGAGRGEKSVSPLLVLCNVPCTRTVLPPSPSKRCELNSSKKRLLSAIELNFQVP